MIQVIRNTLLPFFLLAAAIIVSSYFIINSQSFREMPDLLAMASTVDLTLLIPIIYFLFIRKTTIPKVTLIPVFIISYLIASVLLPAEHHQTLSIIEFAIPVIELGAISFIIYKIRNIAKAYKKEHGQRNLGFVETIHRATANAFGEGTVAKVFATEISIFHYALFGWNRQLEAPSNNFTYHKENGYVSFMAVIVFALIAETAIFHIWLSSWSLLAAWILTAISIYSSFFLLGDFNAARKRPIYFSDKGLELRIGLRWRATIPIDEIELVTFRTPDKEKEDFANLVLTLEGNTVIYFKSEIKAEGLYGLQKKFKRLSIHLDDKVGFKAELEQRLASKI
jgi:ABC-type multidrug transport system fused ATPase/permease subunit